MEYTDKEQQILLLMQGTDFKNISKNDVISFASKLGELCPEVAKDVLVQFPLFGRLIIKYKKVILSQDMFSN